MTMEKRNGTSMTDTGIDKMKTRRMKFEEIEVLFIKYETHQRDL